MLSSSGWEKRNDREPRIEDSQVTVAACLIRSKMTRLCLEAVDNLQASRRLQEIKRLADVEP